MTAEGKSSRPGNGDADREQPQGAEKWHWGRRGKCDKQADCIYSHSFGKLKQYFLHPANGMSERINNLFRTCHYGLVYFPFFGATTVIIGWRVTQGALGNGRGS